MPPALPLNPATAALIFLIAGAAGVLTFSAYDLAGKLRDEFKETEAADWRPLLPWEGPPGPALLVTKPALAIAIASELRSFITQSAPTGAVPASSF